jgi:hypothetical protein
MTRPLDQEQAESKSMRVYYDQNLTQKEVRLFPYTAANASQSGYVDFHLHPDLIETSLEDFRPIAATAFAQSFFGFLRWINGSSSALLTCDCGVRPPGPHNDSNSRRLLSTHGRVFVLYRDLRVNCSSEHADWLCGRTMQELRMIDPDFSANEGVVAFTQQPVLHTEISNGVWHGAASFEAGENDPGFGKHLMLSYWAYGDTPQAAFDSAHRITQNIWSAFRIVSDAILSPETDQSR